MLRRKSKQEQGWLGPNDLAKLFRIRKLSKGQVHEHEVSDGVWKNLVPAEIGAENIWQICKASSSTLANWYHSQNSIIICRLDFCWNPESPYSSLPCTFRSHLSVKLYLKLARDRFSRSVITIGARYPQCQEGSSVDVRFNHRFSNQCSSYIAAICWDSLFWFEVSVQSLFF